MEQTEKKIVKKKKKTRKLKLVAKISLVVILILLIAWAGVGIYMIQHKGNTVKLQEKGFAKEEIQDIQHTLREESIETLLTYDYHKTIVNIIKEKDFQETLLNRYLDFLSHYETASAHDIVFLVNHDQDKIAYTPDIHDILNHKNFQEKNLDRYLSYYQKYELDGDKVIVAVNSDLDKEDIVLDDTTSLFLGRTYTVKANLNRYQKYYQSHKNLDIDEIITRVNSNLDKEFYTNTQKADLSKGNLIIVNKFYYLSSSYVPSDLVTISSSYGRGQVKEEAYNAFIKMYNAAAKEGLYLYISSPYRSYSRQKSLYNNYVSKDGKAEADTYSARPGFSEHQTGLAMDLGTKSNHSIDDFEKSKEFVWTKEHAYEYGFILRYPKGKEYITGYIYEPWHYRYVGTEVAKYIYEHDITYEEYYEYFVK